MKKLFPIRHRAANPRVIVRTHTPTGEPDTSLRTAAGWFYLVFPTDEREVSFLAMLEHGVDKFAPASGNGVYVRADKLKSPAA